MPLVQTRGAASAQGFGEFAQASAVPNYIEEVFSCFLYSGNSSTQTITNGIDLSTKGGLVWIKDRTTGSSLRHQLYDTARGATKSLQSNATDAEETYANGLTSFGTTGFSLGDFIRCNATGYNYVSWSFRKQPKFFDVVTYTGTASAQNIAHNLGSTPACIIVKKTSGTSIWSVYHSSLGGADKFLLLNATDAVDSAASLWNNTAPTSTQFTVGTSGSTNGSGNTFVAYLFASNAGGFGLTGTDNVISCGSYTEGAAGTEQTINLGYEAQWLLIKPASISGSWYLYDTMRSFSQTNNRYLLANSSNAEASTNDYLFKPTATGFIAPGDLFTPGTNVIYMAIRRGPMKVPTSGTSVFSPEIGLNASTNGLAFDAGFVTDFLIRKYRPGVSNIPAVSRLTGDQALLTTTTGAQYTETYASKWDSMLGVLTGTAFNFSDQIGWTFRRAPSFFDVVCYTGDNNARNITHNLTVAPELIIIKRRSNANSWFVWHSAFTTGNNLELNSTGAPPYANGNMSPLPSSSVFSIGGTYPDNSAINLIGQTYVAYLFATCAGVSKCFSYTGNGSSQTINCGFTGGSRFVMIKRTDSAGDWYVWDSARGIVSGNDPHLSLNTTADEVTSDDTIDTDSTGFVVNQVSATNVNVSSATYIGIAIA